MPTEIIKMEKCDIFNSLRSNVLAIQHNVVGIRKHQSHTLYRELEIHTDKMLDDIEKQLISNKCHLRNR